MRRAPRVALAITRGLDYQGAFVRGLARYMHAHGEWDVYTSNGLPFLAQEEIGAWRGDGMIVGARMRDDLYDALRSLGIPAVSVAEDAEDIPLPRVIFDDPATGRSGAEHFLIRGFHHFAYCGRMKDAWYSVRRAEGFQRALAEKGHCCSIFDSTLPRLAQGVLEKDEGLTA
ncbi:MAG: hypothetical protein NTW86_19225 [Candidatus Sumerlaeota bacterium]|nr:hypothetical protein [Candidatus Sumerlaeota bacterium]